MEICSKLRLLFLVMLAFSAFGCGVTQSNTQTASNSGLATPPTANTPVTGQNTANGTIPSPTLANGNSTTNVAVVPDAGKTSGGASIKVKDTKAAAGSEVTVDLELESKEDIGAMVFTLDFDPAVFTYVSSTLSPKAPKSAVLTLNDKQTGSGKLGALMDSTVPFSQGKNTVMSVVFKISSDAPARDHQFSFSSKPAIQSVSNIKTGLVETKFIPGNVRVTSR